MKNPEERIDLSPLDPEADPERLDRVVSRVLERLGPGLVRDDSPLIDDLSRFFVQRHRVVLAVAAVLVVAAFVTRSEASPTADSGIDIPAEWAVWLATGQTPAAEDLLLTLASEDRPNE